MYTPIPLILSYRVISPKSRVPLPPLFLSPRYISTGFYIALPLATQVLALPPQILISAYFRTSPRERIIRNHAVVTRWLNCFTADRKPQTTTTKETTTNVARARACTPTSSTRSLPSLSLATNTTTSSSPSSRCRSLFLSSPRTTSSLSARKVKDLIREPVSIGGKRVHRQLRDEGKSLYWSPPSPSPLSLFLSLLRVRIYTCKK